nr:hypothetical protein CFP56_78642 [Quercus suber]
MEVLEMQNTKVVARNGGMFFGVARFELTAGSGLDACFSRDQASYEHKCDDGSQDRGREISNSDNTVSRTRPDALRQRTFCPVSPLIAYVPPLKNVDSRSPSSSATAVEAL